MIKKIIFILFLFLTFITGASVYSATELVFSSLLIETKQNEVFDLGIKISPDSLSDFITSIELRYQPDFLEVVGFELGEELSPFVNPRYNVIDNDIGLMIKSGQFKNESKEELLFGTVKFRTKKKDVGLIRVGDNTLIVNSRNKNVLSKSFPSIVVASRELGQKIYPSQLFDINLELDKKAVSSLDQLVARVIFISFGEIPTTVEINFEIFDPQDNLVYDIKEYITVETEEVREKKFGDIRLKEGEYKLKVTTVYGDGVKDEFVEEFDINEAANGDDDGMVRILLYCFVFVAIIAIILLIAKMRGEELSEEYTEIEKRRYK